MAEQKNSITINGLPVDHQTRCQHYHGPFDIIAIKFACCLQYYPCYDCHEATAGHPARVWEKNAAGVKAILCGVCLNELTIAEYKSCNNECPFCHALFNPKCVNHHHLYFGQ